MKSLPLVSIITPTYNSSKYIAKTIDSIRSQTYANWELLITDDCSTDNTTDIVKQYIANDSRIKLFVLNKNSGGGVARNNSIRESKGRYIAFCDSDDMWFPEKLEKQISFMQKNHYSFSYTSYLTCNDSGENLGIIICRKKETFKTVRRDDKIGCLTAVYDSEILGKVYMPVIRKRQDWGLMLNVLKKSNCAYGIKEPLAIYRLSCNSISSDKKSLVKYNIGLYHEVLGWSMLKSALFFTCVFMPCYISKKILVALYNR